MKKNWWLDLYTIPGLKKIVSVNLLISGFAFLFCSLAPGFSSYIFGFAMFGSLLIGHEKRVAFAFNMEFHKLHLSYPELRKAFVFDLCIQGSAIIFFSYLNIFLLQGFISSVGISAEEKLFIWLMYVAPFLFAAFPILPLAGVRTDKTRLYSMLDQDLYKFWKFPYFLGVSFIVFILVFTWLGLLSMHPITFFFFIIGVKFCGYINYILKAVFHLEMRRGTITNDIKYNLKGAGMMALFFALMIGVARPLINYSTLNPNLRHFAFLACGNFAPQLDLETAKEFLVINGGGIAALDLIFEKTPDIGMLPVTEVVLHPSEHAYYYYVQNARPSLENQIYVLEQIKAKKMTGEVSYLIATRIAKEWPKNQKFPEHLVDLKLKKPNLPEEARMPAADPAGP